MKANLVRSILAVVALQTVLMPVWAGSADKSKKVSAHHQAASQDGFDAIRNMNITSKSNNKAPRVVARTGAHANEGLPVYAAPHTTHGAAAMQGSGYYRVGRVPLPTPEEYRTPWVKPQDKKVAEKPVQDAPTFTYEAYRTWHKPAGHSK